MLNRVVYRLNMMADADEYVKAMGFKCPVSISRILQNQRTILRLS